MPSGTPPPEHELAGPFAALVLDGLPPDVACAQAVCWLDNPVVRSWWWSNAPTALDAPMAVEAVLDTLWPAGMRLVLEGDLGGHLTGGLEVEACAELGREADGRACAAVQTRAGISITQAIGTRTEDAFRQAEAARRLESSGQLALHVRWDVDGMFRLGAVVAEAMLAREPTACMAAALADAALQAAPDVALEAGVQARAEATLEALEEHGLQAPLRGLLAPLLDRAGLSGMVALSQRTRIEALGNGLLDATLEISGTLDTHIEAILATIPELIAPDDLDGLEEHLAQGARCTLGLRLGPRGEREDAWMSIATFHQAGRFGRRTTQTARSRAEVAALLGRGTQPRACTRSVQRILRPEEADAISPWMCRTVGALLGAMPGAQQQVSFSLLAEAHVPAAAIAAAREAGLEPGKPGDEVDAILSVAMGAPLPAGTNRAAARAGVALLPAAPRLRLRGQRAIGAGGAVSAGAVEDASLTARARAGLQLDHPVSPSEAPALLAALTGNASNYS